MRKLSMKNNENTRPEMLLALYKSIERANLNYLEGLHHNVKWEEKIQARMREKFKTLGVISE